jgi:hypothetical protein
MVVVPYGWADGELLRVYVCMYVCVYVCTLVVSD